MVIRWNTKVVHDRERGWSVKFARNSYLTLMMQFQPEYNASNAFKEKPSLKNLSDRAWREKNGDVLGIFQYWCHQRYTCYRQVLDFQHGIILTPNGVARILGSPTRAEDHLSPRQERFEHQNHTTTVDITSLYPTLTPDYDSIYFRTSDLEIPLCNNSPSKTPRKQKD